MHELVLIHQLRAIILACGRIVHPGAYFDSSTVGCSRIWNVVDVAVVLAGVDPVGSFGMASTTKRMC